MCIKKIKLKDNINMKQNKNVNSKFLKLVLYLSAFIPMYALLFVKFIVEIINNNLSFNILNSLMLLTLVILTTFSGVSMLIIFKRKMLKTQTIKIKSFSNTTDQHFLSYFSLFVLFALTFELEKISMALIFVFILTMIGFVYIKNNLYYINPFFNILGYSFYDVTAIDENGKETKLKIFYKGKLEENKTYNALVGTSNFIILEG